MKKVLLAVLLAGVTLSATAAQTIRFATEASYPPFESIDANNKIVGFDVDLANALCKEIDATCTFSNQAFDSLIPSLKFRRIDAVMAGMDITPEREKQVLFSTPYYDNSALFIGQKGKFTSIDQLKGKKVGVGLGTNYEEWLRQNVQGVDVRTYDDDPTKYQDLRVGRIDAILVDRLAALDLVKKTNNTLAVTGEAFSRQEAGVALRKGNDDLLKAVDGAIADMQKDGSLKALSEKWFGADVTK